MRGNIAKAYSVRDTEIFLIYRFLEGLPYTMKVLYLTNIPSPYRVDFFQELGKYCDLTVLYELDKAKDRNENWKSIQKKKSYREIFLKVVFERTSSAWCPEVRKYLKDTSYDVTVVGGYSTPTGLYAIQYLKRNHIPYILNCDGGFIREKETFIKKKIKSFFISGASAYLSTGKECDKYLAYYGAENQKICHYPFTSLHENEILKEPSSGKQKKAIKEMLGIKEDKVILSVGSFIRRKGFDVLLSAMGRLNRAYGVYIIGGTRTEEYCSIIKQNNLTHVHFIPFLNSDKLCEYYQAADLFVFPTREDIWGLVINEAMAKGLPIITTDKCVAGLELVYGCGEIVPSENAQIMADVIEKYLEDKELNKKASAVSLKRIQRYTIENMSQAHMKIFDEYLNGRIKKQ